MKRLLPFAIAAMLLTGCAGTAFDERAAATKGSPKMAEFCKERVKLVKQFGMGKQVVGAIGDTIGKVTRTSKEDTTAVALDRKCGISFGGLGWRY